MNTVTYMRVRPGDGKVEPCPSLSSPGCVGILNEDAELRFQQLMETARLPWIERTEYCVILVSTGPEPMWVLMPRAREWEAVSSFGDA